MKHIRSVPGAQPGSQHHIYVHAGCPATGRLSTLHAYDLQTNQWKILAAAPEPGRGGTVLVATTIAGDTDILLRYGGE